MEIDELDKFDGTNQAEEALLRMMSSATSRELKQAFDEYLAILDRWGLADFHADRVQSSKTMAQGGTD